MIHADNNTKLINAVFYMRLAISRLAYGAKIVWEVISSCFGSGTWKDANNWRDNENWKNQ